MAHSTREFLRETQSRRQTVKRFRSLSSSLPLNLERRPSVFLVTAKADGLLLPFQGPARAMPMNNKY
jgi:hypothetical protein